MAEEKTPDLDQELQKQLADVPEHTPVAPTKLVVEKKEAVSEDAA